MRSSLHRRLVTCSTTVALVGALACGDDPDGWHPADIDGEETYYSSVWGASAEDVFVVGGVRNGLIYHFDGDSWEPMQPPPKTPALIWVFGFAPDDVYAVGERGAFIHYDGDRWTDLDSNTSKVLWGAWGSAPDALWLVGGEIGRGRPTIRRWNGSESEVFEVDPAEYHEDVHALFKVWGDGSTVYAVGQAGTILRYAGDSWTGMETGETSHDFISIWGTSPDEVVAVGGRGIGRIARLDGDAFQTTTPDEVGGVSAVYACDDRILVGGDPGFVGSLDGTDVEVEYQTLNPVHDIWSSCEGMSIAVGGFFIDPPADAVATIER